MIHSSPEIDFEERETRKNHGLVIIEEILPYNKLWSGWAGNKENYFKYVCYPQDWLLLE